MYRQLHRTCSAVMAVAFASCSVVPHEGASDAGLRACVTSACSLSGAWNATYTVVDAGSGLSCSPTPGPLHFTSDGGTVCMLGAESGASDGGCRFSFLVRRNNLDYVGEEHWSFRTMDAGVLAGTLSISMVFPQCSTDYTVHAER